MMDTGSKHNRFAHAKAVVWEKHQHGYKKDQEGCTDRIKRVRDQGNTMEQSQKGLENSSRGSDENLSNL